MEMHTIVVEVMFDVHDKSDGRVIVAGRVCHQRFVSTERMCLSSCFGTALVDMYAKCGDLCCLYHVFSLLFYRM